MSKPRVSCRLMIEYPDSRYEAMNECSVELGNEERESLSHDSQAASQLGERIGEALGSIDVSRLDVRCVVSSMLNVLNCMGLLTEDDVVDEQMGRKDVASLLNAAMHMRIADEGLYEKRKADLDDLTNQ